ncbi:hypothetical protein Vi05172_g11040 [Venturia inaequalis]|uniref:Uncharacterized protein n=2 Tax=Venturia inaequalis TaxID=5025 RepID=A0A8H3V4N5_VENIN|nr:hypothetical protein EG327_006379 [Venturia inaequalis]RDI78970.1 hypothetical protein Vi05172_g11040 [Venturia inaequalis]
MALQSMIPAPQQAHGYSSNNGYQVMYGFDFNQPPIQHPAQQPPSPTLTNPEMILPFEIENHIIRTPSPTRGNQTPSPAATPPGLGRPLTYGNSMPNSYVNFSRTSPQSHHRISTALSDIEEVDTTPTGPRYPGIKPATLASSPALKENGAMGLVDWKTHSRRLSDGSSSVHSEELANMKWPGFDSAHGTDVESVVLEEEEDNYGTLPKVVDSDDGSVIDEPWLGPHAGEDDDEDLLSKRADMILANAKQRLNVLEGNLRGARHSLLATPSLPKTPPYITALANFSRDRTSSGRSQRLSFSSPISPNFGHSRMQSDTSPAPILSIPPRLPLLQKRSSSALGSFAGGLSHLERSASLRGVRSQEIMRESRLQTWMEETPTQSSVISGTGRSMSQQNFHRSRTPSVESLRRPASSASDIRAQMDELKGRISTLKERAHEDRMKRMSVNSLRAPSPFTASDKWQSDVYKSGTKSAEWSQNSSPVIKQDEFSSPYYLNNSELKSSPPRAFDGTEYTESSYDDAEELLGDIKEEPEELDETSTPSTTVYAESYKKLIGPRDPIPDEFSVKGMSDETAKAQFEDEYPEYDDSADDESLDGQSEYHEAVPVLAERHEDRLDAFDYEHFFLHSAMGSFTRDRRNSSSSDESLETTRPASPPRRASVTQVAEDPQLLHRRSQSSDSVSTVQSFATAAEDVDSDDGSDDGPDPLDLATEHLFVPQIHTPQNLSPQHPVRPNRNSRRLDSAVHMTSDDDKMYLDGDAGYSNGNVKQRPVSALVSSLLEIHNMVAGSEMDESDMQLVEGLIKSLKSTCFNLQSLAADDYERRVLRRRLDEAKRALDG